MPVNRKIVTLLQDDSSDTKIIIKTQNMSLSSFFYDEEKITFASTRMSCLYRAQSHYHVLPDEFMSEKQKSERKAVDSVYINNLFFNKIQHK